MTSQFRASSQLELVDTQIRLAKANLTSSAQDRLLEGYAAVVAAFTRANLIVSTADFKERDEQAQWEKLKLEAHKLQGQYEAKLANTQIVHAQQAPTHEKPEAAYKERAVPLSDQERAQIETLYSRGVSMPKIAEQLGRSYQTVYSYIRAATAPQNGKAT